MESSQGKGPLKTIVPSLDVGDIYDARFVSSDFCKQADYNLLHWLLKLVALSTSSEKRATYSSVCQDTGKIKVLHMDTF